MNQRSASQETGGINPSRIKAVVFDCFGTLLQIQNRKSPYRELLNLLKVHGHQPSADDAQRIMSADVGITGTPHLFGIDLSADELIGVEHKLMLELASIRPFKDAIYCLSILRQRGYRIGVCSNLAKPYHAVASALLPKVDLSLWSFEQGCIKPEPRIYQRLCNGFECQPDEILMVGDSLKHDVEGAKANGLQALHLNRSAEKASALHTLYDLLSLLPHDPSVFLKAYGERARKRVESYRRGETPHPVKEYAIGTEVWIAGVVESGLYGGKIVHRFKLNDSTHPNDWFYIVEYPTSVDALLTVRTWSTISEHPDEPLNWSRFL